MFYIASLQVSGNEIRKIRKMSVTDASRREGTGNTDGKKGALHIL